MKITGRIQLLLVLLFACGFVFQSAAQNDESNERVEQRNLPFTVRFDGGLGNLVRPKAMKNNFYSVGDIDGGVHFGLAKGFNLGLNMRYTGFQVRQGASNVNDTIIEGFIYQVRTIYNAYTPGLTISYDKWVGHKSFFNFHLNGGYSFVNYTKIRKAYKGSPNDSKFQTLLIEPAVNFVLFFQDRVAFSMKLSYTWTNGWFRPEKMGLDQGTLPYVSSDLKGNIQYISFGFGFIYSLKRVS